MAYAIPIIMAVTAAVGAYAAVQQGKAVKAASEFNSQMAVQNAQWEREQSALEAQQVKRENYLRLGAIRAIHGKSGGVATEGSVLDVLGDTAAQGELERIETMKYGAKKAYGYEAQASLQQSTGRNAETAGYFKAGTELIGGGASAAGAYSRVR